MMMIYQEIGALNCGIEEVCTYKKIHLYLLWRPCPNAVIMIGSWPRPQQQSREGKEVTSILSALSGACVRASCGGRVNGAVVRVCACGGG